jgi:tetratricopeptide (TPR) repeat protein
MVHDAQEVLSALKTQIEVAHQEIDSLKLEAASQLEKMVMDAQQMKDQTIQELTNLLPLSTQEALPPDVQPRIGKLTALLESLKAAIPQITFTASDYLKQGNALFFEGRYDDAVAAYDRAIQLHPELYEAWFSKASTLMLLQQYEEATVAYTTATQLRPDAYDAWMGRGAAQARQHQFEAAIAAYSQALELRPEDYLACYNRGNAVLESGQAAAAIEDFTQALALKPDLGRALVRRALAHQVLGQHGDAIADCQQALALNETDAEAWYTLACSYALQSPEDDGRDMARTALTQAIALAPTNRERARQDPVFGFLQGEEGVW